MLGDCGHFELFGKADGWGTVDDNESIQAIRKAIDLVLPFDTADVYGAGHSEEVLGKALKGIRDKVVIASKFGYTFDPKAKKAEGLKYDPEYIKKACHESLRRLATDYIDLYLLHIGDLAKEEGGGVMETLEELKNEGLIRSYGWSTDDSDRAEAYAGRANFTAVEYDFNLFLNADGLIKVAKGIIRQHNPFTPWLWGFQANSPRQANSRQMMWEQDMIGSGT